MPGGQIATSDMVDNYPGIPDVSGAELGQKMLDHAESAGAEVAYAMVLGIEHAGDGMFTVKTDSSIYTAPALIVATGATPRMVGFEVSRPTADAVSRIARHATVCLSKQARVRGWWRQLRLRGGLYLSRIASDVVMVVRRDEFRAPRGRVESLLAQDNVSVKYSTSIVRVEGDRLLSTVTFRDNATGEEYTETYPEGSFGIFVFAGNDPVLIWCGRLSTLHPMGEL